MSSMHLNASSEEHHGHANLTLSMRASADPDGLEPHSRTHAQGDTPLSISAIKWSAKKMHQAIVLQHGDNEWPALRLA